MLDIDLMAAFVVPDTAHTEVLEDADTADFVVRQELGGDMDLAVFDTVDLVVEGRR